MIKILMVLTNGFDPDIRVYKEAKYLCEKGCYVEILAWDRELKHAQEETAVLDGIHIRRLFIKSKYGSGLKQLIPFLIFKKRVNHYIKHHYFDYIHCHDLDGCLFTSAKKQKIVFDMHEFYFNKKRFINRLIQKAVRHCQKKAFRILYVNDFQIRSAAESVRNKCVFLPNYPERNVIHSVEKTESPQLRVCYYGVVRQFEELKILIDCAKTTDSLFIHIAGSGIASKRISEYGRGIPNVLVEGGYNGLKDSAKLYSESDLIYCVYPESNINLTNALPVKFFESIASGTPVIAGLKTAMAPLIKEKNIGYLLGKNDYSSLLALLNSILDNREDYERIRKNVLSLSSEYSWSFVKKGLDFYLSI